MVSGMLLVDAGGGGAKAVVSTGVTSEDATPNAEAVAAAERKKMRVNSILTVSNVKRKQSCGVLAGGLQMTMILRLRREKGVRKGKATCWIKIASLAICQHWTHGTNDRVSASSYSAN
ncbi:hypothetical protein FH972_025974 [Carpinus fangiana]|uniref:Uncharacterized protein n=1 Tax=Carpinus fangiana TaxID=176857 RepID=A0A5N6L2K0_9ROSI|nr:hypothetical protein FH972_025974 [Carpinus fangiana]